MEKGKVKIDWKIFGKTLIVVIVTFVLYKISNVAINKLPVSDIMHVFLRECVLMVLVLIAAMITKRVSTLKLTTKGFGIGLLLCAWFLVQSGLALIVSKIGGGAQITEPAGQVIILIISSFMIGIAEELLFRGIMLNGMLETFGEDSPRNIRTAIIVAGCLFGVLHLFNIFSGASIIGSLTQAVLNIPCGMLYGIAYVRARKNMWPGIIVHGLNDLLGFISAGLLAGATFADVVSSYTPIVFIYYIPVLVIAIIAMRNSKLQPLTKEA